MMDAVHRYEGYVAQALGDGIFALFGAPIAHEDHPQRALYAALRMQEEMRRYAETVRLKHGVTVEMRVGINTGEVVVRSIRKDDLHTDYVPVGHSTNLAARMEQMATPGSILVSTPTHKLTEGYFDFQSSGQDADQRGEEPLDDVRSVSARARCARDCKWRPRAGSPALSGARVSWSSCSAPWSRPKPAMGRSSR